MGVFRGIRASTGGCGPSGTIRTSSAPFGFALAALLCGLVMVGQPMAATIVVYEGPAIAPSSTLHESPVGQYRRGSRTALLIGSGLAGFCALGCEVLWTRSLVFYLGVSVSPQGEIVHRTSATPFGYI